MQPLSPQNEAQALGQNNSLISTAPERQSGGFRARFPSSSNIGADFELEIVQIQLCCEMLLAVQA